MFFCDCYENTLLPDVCRFIVHRRACLQNSDPAAGRWPSPTGEEMSSDRNRRVSFFGPVRWDQQCAPGASAYWYVEEEEGSRRVCRSCLAVLSILGVSVSGFLLWLAHAMHLGRENGWLHRMVTGVFLMSVVAVAAFAMRGLACAKRYLLASEQEKQAARRARFIRRFARCRTQAERDREYARFFGCPRQNCGEMGAGVRG